MNPYILGGNHRDHGGGTLFGQQGGFLYSCSFGSRKNLDSWQFMEHILCFFGSKGTNSRQIWTEHLFWQNASMTHVRRFQASSLRVFFSWNECHRWWLSWVRSPLWEHHAPARHLCISGQQRQESAIELVSGLESGLYMVGLGLWSMKIFSWQRVWTRYIITCLPFAAGMDETVSDCRSRRGGWSHQMSNWSAANIGLESVMFDLFMRDDQDLGYQWVSCMFLCPLHHLSSLSTKKHYINQELQLFRGLTSSCSFWSHHFFDSAANFNISWAKGKFSEVVKYHSVSHQNFWDIWPFPTWRRWVLWEFFDGQVLKKWCFKAMFRTGSQDLRWLSLPLSIHHLHKQQRRRCGWEWQPPPRDLIFFWGGNVLPRSFEQICVFFCQRERKRRDHMHVIDDTLTIPTPVEGAYDFRGVLPGLDITKPSMMRHAQQILLSYEWRHPKGWLLLPTWIVSWFCMSKV